MRRVAEAVVGVWSVTAVDADGCVSPAQLADLHWSECRPPTTGDADAAAADCFDQV